MTTMTNPTTTLTARPLRFRIGVALLVLYVLLWTVVLVVPFLPLDGGLTAGLAGGIGVGAEALLLVAIACVGKESYHALKARLLRKKGSDDTAR